jgi:hypothetical protein
MLQVNASLGDWQDAAAAYQAAADAWGDMSQQQQRRARALLGCGVALDRAVSLMTQYGCDVKYAVLTHEVEPMCSSARKL